MIEVDSPEMEMEENLEYAEEVPEPVQTVRTRSCTIPLVRVEAGLTHPSKECNEKIDKLSARVELLEGNCRLLRRRVRALEMERSEDIRRTVLEVLNKQRFTISTSFGDENNDLPRSRSAVSGRPRQRQNGNYVSTAFAQYSSSDEDVVASPRRDPTTNTSNRSSSTGPRPLSKRKLPLIVKHIPSTRTRVSKRSGGTASMKIEEPVETHKQEQMDEDYTGHEDYDEQIFHESAEDDNPEIISEGDVGVILEDYDDPDYVEEGTETINTQPPPDTKPRTSSGKHRRRKSNFDLSNRSEAYKREYYRKKRHEKLMLDAKRYVCDQCDGRTFKSNWELKRHSRIHYKELAYACPICPNKSYTQVHNLTKHNQRHHPDK